ncbi:MAG: hypothetical protein AB7U83_07910 [Vicinamibacterales bacterium]
MSTPGAPSPLDRTSVVPPHGPPHAGGSPHAGGPPARLERVMVDLQDAGLAPSELERVFSWWKRFGGRRAAVLALAVALPLLRYEYVPYVLSRTVETTAEAYGLDLTVGEWSGSLADIKVVGKDVAITTRGPFQERRLFHADAIEFDWSLARAVANGWDRVKGCWTAILLQPCTLPDEAFHRVSIDGATLHLERTLAGAWNTDAAFDVQTVDELARLVHGMRVPEIDAREVTVAWVEHLPGDSGGGLLERRTSKLEFAHVVVGIENLQLPIDARDNPTRFSFDGETADGQVSVAGVLNVARWNRDAWTPSYDLTFQLANFGAASMARFAAPDATLVPKTGTVDGTVRLASDGRERTVCRIDLALRDVTYAPNPRSPYSRTGGKAFDEQVAPVRINAVVAEDCLQPLRPPGPRTLPPGDVPPPARPTPVNGRIAESLQTVVTASALQDAPPLVRGAASFDQATVVEGRTLTPDQIAADVATHLGQSLAGDRGAAVAKALTADDGSGGNALTRGARSVGRGLRRLFGGGDSKPAQKRPPDR